jgi:hypothetical protein
MALDASLTAIGFESTSPYPTIPASVVTLTISVLTAVALGLHRAGG